MSADERIATRSSAALRNIVLSYGQLSTATRALLIVGAVTLGTPVATLEEEILDLDLLQLQPDTRARLLSLLNSRATSVVHDPVPPSPVAETSRGDDLFGVGFDV